LSRPRTPRVEVNLILETLLFKDR